MPTWLIVLIASLSIYSILIGLSTVIKNNYDYLQSVEELEINLKWMIVNFFSFLWNTVFTFIKYVIAIVWTAILLCLLLLALGLMILAGDTGNSSPFGDWEPYAFMSDWFHGEVAFFRFVWSLISEFIIAIWRGLCAISKVVWMIFKAIGKFVIYDPFCWLRKNFGKIFEMNFFTIKKK